MRTEYLAHMKATTPTTSHKATSYVRALDMLAAILASEGVNLWALRGTELDALYTRVKADQKDTSSAIYANGMPRSYASGGYYSAAVNELRKFLEAR